MPPIQSLPVTDEKATSGGEPALPLPDLNREGVRPTNLGEAFDRAYPPSTTHRLSDFIGLKQLSIQAGVSESTLRNRIAAGELPARRCGRRLLVRVADAERWMQSFPAEQPRGSQ